MSYRDYLKECERSNNFVKYITILDIVFGLCSNPHFSPMWFEMGTIAISNAHVNL